MDLDRSADRLASEGVQLRAWFSIVFTRKSSSDAERWLRRFSLPPKESRFGPSETRDADPVFSDLDLGPDCRGGGSGRSRTHSSGS